MSLMSMTVTSFTFLMFIGLFTVIYYLMPKKKYQWVMMLCANFFFYVCACSKLKNAIIQIVAILFTALVTYVATQIIQSYRDKNKIKMQQAGELTRDEKKEYKKQLQKKIKRVQVITIIIELGCLAVVKYLRSTIVNINTIFDSSIPEISILAPLGISFYTFASLGYVLDVARGKYTPEKNYFKVLTFLSFFPSIIQGPINRFDEVGTQIFSEHKFDYNRLVKGAELMLWGFFKKLVIADRAVNIVTTVFSASDYRMYSGSQFLFAAVVYFFQIYGDFSGGIDICRGAAEILGIDLPLNFERPLFSLSVTEFWRRWHITLGAWMRDYVFYSVMLSKPVLKLSQKFSKRFGKFAGKMVPSIITPAVVFFLMGIWHGASFQYIAYAIYYSFVTSSSVAFEGVFKKMKTVLHVNEEAFSYKIFCMLRVFALTTVSRIIVKAPGLRAMLFIFKSIITNFNANFIFGLDGKFFDLGLDAKNMFILFISIIILSVVSILQENGIHIRDSLNKQNLVFRWIILIALFVFVLIFGQYGEGYNASSFIYQAY